MSVSLSGPVLPWRRAAVASLVAPMMIGALLFTTGGATTLQAEPPATGQASAQGAGTSIPREGTYLYRFSMLQAAPGRLVELIDFLKSRATALAAGGDQLPYIVRHSQGDHWDLLVVYPLGSLAEYYGRDREAARAAAGGATGLAPVVFAPAFRSMLAWHEDLFVLGPPVDAFRAHVDGAGLAHFEMMQALPGRYEQLVEERRMENAFNRGRGRGETLIFTHELGAAWDVVTLGVYRNWREYAESDTIPAEVAQEAARKAGFASAEAVGPYMRTLISTHRDTLGPPVTIPAR